MDFCHSCAIAGRRGKNAIEVLAITHLNPSRRVVACGGVWWRVVACGGVWQDVILEKLKTNVPVCIPSTFVQ